MLKDTQLSLQDVSEEYQAFVSKFKPKKTTDDCYTPDNIYQAVKSWACAEYSIDPETIVRPFWPGGDYERFEYPTGCTVLDNPPFSIISSICANYVKNGIRFFLFAPYLTNFQIMRGGSDICHIITDSKITYENGAIVNTCFVTNLDHYIVRTAPKLRELLDACQKEKKQVLPVYEYPPEVLTATMAGFMSKWGVEYKLKSEDCLWIRALDCQKPDKTIFGAGFLLSAKAAAEKVKAMQKATAISEKIRKVIWELSQNERKIIGKLGVKHE